MRTVPLLTIIALGLSALGCQKEAASPGPPNVTDNSAGQTSTDPASGGAQVGMTFVQDDLKPRLANVAKLVTKGFGAAEIDQMVDQIKRTPSKQKTKRIFDIVYKGQKQTMTIAADMGSEKTPYVTFDSSDPAMLPEISKAIG